VPGKSELQTKKTGGDRKVSNNLFGRGGEGCFNDFGIGGWGIKIWRIQSPVRKGVRGERWGTGKSGGQGEESNEKIASRRRVHFQGARGRSSKTKGECN